MPNDGNLPTENNQQADNTQSENTNIGSTPPPFSIELLEQAVKENTLLDTLKSWLAEEQAETIVRYYEQQQYRFERYQYFFHELIIRNGYDQKLMGDIDLWLTEIFQSKIVVIEDSHISGDGLIETITNHTPPGLICRIMGMQNIKGTGLDFAYRWQAWEKCHGICQKVLDDDKLNSTQGIVELSSFEDYGILSEKYVLSVIELVSHQHFAQTERYQVAINVIKSNLAKSIRRREKQDQTKQLSSGLSLVIGVIEAFLDVGEAVKRRKKADQIYKDIATQRISTNRAIEELALLTDEQKGGWLSNKLRSRNL